jgi:hypothetical protein
MAEYFEDHPSLIATCSVSQWVGAALAIVFASALICSTSEAQDKACTTVKDCAQQMVALANELKAENVTLTKRINDLEAALASLRTKLSSEFKRVTTEYTPDGAAVTSVNEGGGPGNQTVDCGAGKFLSSIRISKDSGGNYNVRVTCAPVPVFKLE